MHDCIIAAAEYCAIMAYMAICCWEGMSDAVVGCRLGWRLAWRLACGGALDASAAIVAAGIKDIGIAPGMLSISG